MPAPAAGVVVPGRVARAGGRSGSRVLQLGHRDMVPRRRAPMGGGACRTAATERPARFWLHRGHEPTELDSFPTGSLAADPGRCVDRGADRRDHLPHRRADRTACDAFDADGRCHRPCDPFSGAPAADPAAAQPGVAERAAGADLAAGGGAHHRAAADRCADLAARLCGTRCDRGGQGGESGHRIGQPRRAAHPDPGAGAVAAGAAG